MMRYILVLMAVAVLLVACAPGEPPLEGEVPAPDETGGSVPASDTLDTLDAVVADVSNRTGSNETDIAVLVDEKVTWADGALGCPQPGMAYTDALVDGSRIVLELDGVQYSYHAGQDGIYRPCVDPAEPVAANPDA